MIGGVNGANVNLYSGFQNIREQSASHIRPSTDENSLNLSSQKLVQNANQSSDQINLNQTNESKFNKDDEPLKFAKDNSLTGIAANGKISIWGKLIGYDKQMSQDEIDELKSFVSQTGALGFGRLYESIIGYYPTNVDLFAKEYTLKDDSGTLLGLGHKSHVEGFEILDKDLSTEEFKDRWLDYALRQYLGERVGVESITIGKKAISMLTSTNKPPIEYETMQSINFTDDESRQRFFCIPQSRFTHYVVRHRSKEKRTVGKE